MKKGKALSVLTKNSINLGWLTGAGKTATKTGKRSGGFITGGKKTISRQGSSNKTNLGETLSKQTPVSGDVGTPMKLGAGALGLGGLYVASR